MAFEQFNSPALYLANTAVLSLYSEGRTTGVVLDCGAQDVHSVPVFEGFRISHAIKHSPVGGDTVTECLGELLNIQSDYMLDPDYKAGLLRHIKEELGYVALDFRQEQNVVSEERVRYLLPDGTEIFVGSQRYQCSELFFQPNLNVAEKIVNCVKSCDNDIRKDLLNNIVLSGGPAATRGFEQRLSRELQMMYPGHIEELIPQFYDQNPDLYLHRLPNEIIPLIEKNLGMNKTRIVPRSGLERKYGAWIGGSILASLSTFQKWWVSSEEYDETGPRIVSIKCV